jgi:uncharacterized protein (TIGR03437 family)
MKKRYCIFIFGFTFGVSIPAAVYGQSANTVCVVSATPAQVRAEGLAERTGQITYDCTGTPNTSIQVNLTIALNANVTNRLSSGNTLTGIVFTIDSGSGPQAVMIPPLLAGPGTLVYNGVSFQLSSTGSAVLNINNIRANATQLGPNVPIIASLGVSGNLLLTSANVNVGTPRPGLYSSLSSRLVCAQNGSKLPDTIAFSSLIGSGTVFNSTRITEGLADAFQPRNGPANLNADSGERIIVRYSGFPQGARLFVPDVIAGSNAVQPTAGGDFGLPASGGAYSPGGSGSLLLARVAGANANGAGGSPVFAPSLIVGPGPVQFDTVSELQLTNGSAYVVYEVVDADPAHFETAQFPTFLGVPPAGSGNAVTTNESVSFAPVSNVMTATTTDPLPRFEAVTPQPDCSIVGDCNASYLPKLDVQTYNLFGGSTATPNMLLIHNLGTSLMLWTITVTYPPGTPTGWLQPDVSEGANNATVRLFTPVTLPPGTYNATVVVDGGPLAGSKSVPVVYTVAPAPPPPTVTINAVVNAASFAPVPVVPGSLVSVMGSAFTGKSVAVAFDGEQASILFSNDTQINLMVPSDVASSTSKVVVTVDGVSSLPMRVNVAQFAPAIFAGAVVNQDWTVNGVDNGAPIGSIIQIFATGLSGKGTITGRIADRVIAVPYYAGPAPGFPGVQQIDLQIPSDLPAMSTGVSVCGASVDTPNTAVCSVACPLTLK